MGLGYADTLVDYENDDGSISKVSMDIAIDRIFSANFAR